MMIIRKMVIIKMLVNIRRGKNYNVDDVLCILVIVMMIVGDGDDYA